MNSKSIKCRCGREVRRPEVVDGMLLCSECAFDELYGTYRPAPNRREHRDYLRPTFIVRKVS